MRKILSVGALLALSVAHVACSDATFQASSSDASNATLESETGSLTGLAVVSPTCGAESAGRAQDCRVCTEGNCGQNLVECFGDASLTTLDGGVCQTYGQCVMACACGDQVCYQACLDSLQATGPVACTDCLERLLSCETSSCGEVCAGTDAESGAATDGGAADRDARGAGAS